MDQVFNVTGLIGDISKWLTGLIPAAGAAAIGYHSLMKNTSQDDAEAAQRMRAIRRTLIGTALGTGGSGLVAYLMNYVPK